MDAQKLQQIVVIGDDQTCTGFRLAGIKNTFALQGEKAEKKIEELLQEEKAGIIIITEKTMEELDRRLKKRIERTAQPVIITVADKGGPREETESLKSMISRALGFEIKT